VNCYGNFDCEKFSTNKNDAVPIGFTDLMMTGLNSAITIMIANDLKMASRKVGQSLQRLASGNRINSISDGTAADSALIQNFDAQSRGLRQAILNVNDVASLTATADAGLDSMLNLAYQLRELSRKAQDTTLTSAERTLISTEATDLLTDLTNLATYTVYRNTSGAGTYLLDSSFGIKTVQAGARQGSTFNFSIGDARTSTLGKLAIYSGAQGSISAAIGTVTINGTTLTASASDGVSTSQSTYSSLAISNAINASTGTTGVYSESVGTIRTLIANFSSASLYSGILSAGDFKINSASIVGTITTATAFASAINSQTSTTGVIASVSGANVTLTATDGRNIQITMLSGGATASFDNVYNVFNFSTNSGVFSNYASLSQGATPTYVGAVRIWSSSAITIGGTTPSASLGIASGIQGLVAGTSVSAIDLSTSSAAAQANKVLDATIAQISTLRVQVGAVHDRVDYTASFLLDAANAADNARDAIKNVDFVMETANLVMAQLLQQSSLAAMTQANVSLDQVSKLLENL
jgi:flagellin